MPFRIDHIVIRVENLDAAIADYRALGFTVTPGGEHAHGQSHNALIAFQDASYLELVAFKGDPDAVPPGIFRRFLRCTGLVDFALVPEDIAAAAAGAAARGVPFSAPKEGGRLRPDGQEVRWQTAEPDGVDLPFLCADVTPRRLRVPDGDARIHDNGALGVMRVTVAVRDLESSLYRYAALLDASPQHAPAPKARAADLPLGPAAVTLTMPPGETNPLHAHLEACGDGPFSLLLKTSDQARLGRLDEALSHGAHLAMVP